MIDLLGKLANEMKESGNNDVGFAKAKCSYRNGLCRGMRFLRIMIFYKCSKFLLIPLQPIQVCYPCFSETYTMSGKNRLCSRHNKGVTKLEECKMVAKIKAYIFSAKRDTETRPPGCYFLNENEQVYFNTRKNYPYGRKSYVAEQICKSKG